MPQDLPACRYPDAVRHTSFQMKESFRGRVSRFSSAVIESVYDMAPCVG